LILASLVFLTPRGALLAFAALVPLAALVLASRRERSARAALRLPQPGRGRRAWPAVAVALVGGLLAVTASQPALRSTTSVDVRRDAEALFVIDISRSMRASAAPGAKTRIARARDEALQLRDELIDIPSGVATLTDHVLPDVLPVPDRATFEQTIRQAVQVGNPPPSTDAVTATSLGALGALGTQNFFSPEARHRVAIVFTDGESRPFDLRQTAQALAHAPHVRPIFVRVSSPGEEIFGADGRPEPAYHFDASAAETLAGLAQASRGASFDESELGAAARAARAALGSGPTRGAELTVTTRTLAPYAALAALVPLLLLLLAKPSALRQRRRVRFASAVCAFVSLVAAHPGRAAAGDVQQKPCRTQPAAVAMSTTTLTFSCRCSGSKPPAIRSSKAIVSVQPAVG
jgi:hypothetical protein